MIKNKEFMEQQKQRKENIKEFGSDKIKDCLMENSFLAESDINDILEVIFKINSFREKQVMESFNND